MHQLMEGFWRPCSLDGALSFLPKFSNVLLIALLEGSLMPGKIIPVANLSACPAI